MTVQDTVWAMLNGAAGLYRDSPRASNWLRLQQERFREPLRIAIAGPPRSGKSTLAGALPTRALRDTVLIDVPGGAPAPAEADAVVYLLPQLQGTDLRWLQSVRQDSPINAIVVLSRADEVGAGRIDALSSAKQLARRYRKDNQVRALCQQVVAVAGLIGQAAKTLREEEFATLRSLAGVPRTELENFLLSADRFVGADFPVPIAPGPRFALIERFGIFGVRLTTTLVRQGFDNQTKLAAQLVQRSGLSELRESIGDYFLDRRELLKARSALAGLEAVVRTEPRPAARKLAADVERLLASTHEFRELRALTSLQINEKALPNGLSEEALRLVGGDGDDMSARLGLDYEASEAELRSRTFDALRRWQEQSQNPVLDADQRHAAGVVVRSCEGMLAKLAIS